VPFHDDIFPCHVYPFADILKRAKAAFLKDYTVAVRIESSQTRHLPQIYAKSPTESWIEMFERIYPGDEWQDVREAGITLMTVGNPEGLLQLRSFGNTRLVARELSVIGRRRPSVFMSPRFMSYAALALLTPAPVLRRIVDTYKSRILSRSVATRTDTRQGRGGPFSLF
jgi:hypothetical protein